LEGRGENRVGNATFHWEGPIGCPFQSYSGNTGGIYLISLDKKGGEAEVVLGLG